MSRRRVLVLTGSRAEYGAIYWVLMALHSDDAVDLLLIATGSRLSVDHRMAYLTS